MRRIISASIDYPYRGDGGCWIVFEVETDMPVDLVIRYQGREQTFVCGNYKLTEERKWFPTLEDALSVMEDLRIE